MENRRSKVDKWKLENPEKAKESRKKYYDKNREIILGKHKDGTYKRDRDYKFEYQKRKLKWADEARG